MALGRCSQATRAAGPVLGTLLRPLSRPPSLGGRGATGGPGGAAGSDVWILCTSKIHKRKLEGPTSHTRKPTHLKGKHGAIKQPRSIKHVLAPRGRQDITSEARMALPWRSGAGIHIHACREGEDLVHPRVPVTPNPHLGTSGLLGKLYRDSNA